MASDLTHLLRALMRSTSESYEQAFWRPAADVYRAPGGWLIKFDLAGVRPEDIQLVVRGRSLTVLGVRRDWLVHEGQRSYSMEISYNRFQRSIELPCELESARISSEYRDGMLVVRLTTE